MSSLKWERGEEDPTIDLHASLTSGPRGPLGIENSH